jgi:hypothetical protein
VWLVVFAVQLACLSLEAFESSLARKEIKPVFTGFLISESPDPKRIAGQRQTLLQTPFPPKGSARATASSTIVFDDASPTSPCTTVNAPNLATIR